MSITAGETEGQTDTNARGTGASVEKRLFWVPVESAALRRGKRQNASRAKHLREQA